MATFVIHPREEEAALSSGSGLGFGLLLSYLYTYEDVSTAYIIPLLLRGFAYETVPRVG